MGLINGREAGVSRIDGTFTGTTRSDPILIRGLASLSLWDGVGTVQLEKSFDEGATWIPCARDASGTLARWDVTLAAPIGGIGIYEPEDGVLYSLLCVARTSDIRYRVSQ